MPEFFIVANSNAAPMVSDESVHYVDAESSASALERLVSHIYKHPCGLYSAAAYYSADDFHKKARPAARWLSHKALVAQNERLGLKGQIVMG